MNHFFMMVIVSLCVSLVFALLSKQTIREQLHYFATRFAAMVLFSLAFAWFMSVLPF